MPNVRGVSAPMNRGSRCTMLRAEVDQPTASGYHIQMYIDFSFTSQFKTLAKRQMRYKLLAVKRYLRIDAQKSFIRIGSLSGEIACTLASFGGSIKYPRGAKLRSFLLDIHTCAEKFQRETVEKEHL